jgi:hypothetical protein
MIAPPLLQDPAVKRWLAGTEPAWTLLDRKSFEALTLPPGTHGSAIRLAADLSDDEIERSAVARNALLLLRFASEGSGLGLTATGNLSRRVVAEMCELMEWPDFDKAERFQFHEVVNEPDFLPLHFIRHVGQAAGFVQRHKGNLKSTPWVARSKRMPHAEDRWQSSSTSPCGASTCSICREAFSAAGLSVILALFFGRSRSRPASGSRPSG